MIFAAKAMKNGYAVCYAADARVIHSHNYTAVEQFTEISILQSLRRIIPMYSPGSGLRARGSAW